jgi:pyruvate formate-lyase/glycerol dehydratase family glycyl radical enzyme
MTDFTPSKRVRALREELLSTDEILCYERAGLVTESYRNTEGKPLILRRAKALAHVLKNMTLLIRDGELIVGQQTGRIKGVPVFPETGAVWVEEQLEIFGRRKFKRVQVPSDGKEALLKNLQYWKPKTVHHQVYANLPEETGNVLGFECSPISPNLFIRNAIGHLLADYPKVLQLGFDGIRAEAEDLAARLDPTEPNALGKLHFYKAVMIACAAAADFGKRYAGKASELADVEGDPQRRKELKEIARICRRIPASPAESYHEALQSFWFTHLIIQIDTDGLAISPGRFDRYLHDYYQQDLTQKRITREYAQELLNCFWIKFYEIIKLVDNRSLEDMSFGTGNNMSQNLVVGGVDGDGTDATNELSYMCLVADGTVRFDQPSLSVRVHQDTPIEFLTAIVDLIKLGGGKPAIFFDQAAIPALLATGVPLEEARNYALCGCVEPATVFNSYTWANGCMFNLPKCVELALNNGVCLLTGVRMGPKTGTPSELDSYEKVLDAFRKQVDYFIRHMVIVLNTCDSIHADTLPTPFVSAITGGCLSRGKDITAGGADYNHIGVSGIGLADAADALTAVKELVFARQKISLTELNRAMKDDFKGHEGLLKMLNEQSAKYGNGDDRADLIAREIGKFFCVNVSKYRCPRGGGYRPGLFPVSSNVPLGRRVAALPGGHRSMQPLADGISPAPGCDISGPTAVVKSVTKVDHVIVANGTLLNLKFHPAALQDRKGVQSLISLIRTMGARQGMHMQFNVVSAETLRKAQEHPDKHRDLLIRVAGFSAFFVELDQALQDHIISRTEYAL